MSPPSLRFPLEATLNAALRDSRWSRRTFLARAGLATGIFLIGQPGFARTTAANSKLNLGVIGVAGRGGENLKGVSRESVVALCDVDERNLRAAAQQHPAAKTYRDFRQLIAQRDIEAVVVSTPDHTHAVAAVAALESGRHVYCEKPLTRTVSEARLVTELAAKRKLVTQIGTQIHAGENYRRAVELIQSGAIGSVAEVHVWVDVTYGGMDLPQETPPVPSHLDYDLWLGPVEYRPYSPEWVPAKWRHWWAFGGGALADFGCHYMDLPHWALNLRYPSTVEVLEGPPAHPESTPPWLILRYTHAARGPQPPVTLTWYHGGRQPSVLPEDKRHQWKSGVLFVGAKGMLLADYNRRQLLPEKPFEGFVPPAPSIPDSIGHHQEWLAACKTNGPTTCSFDYSGPLTEAALLGNVAFRVGRKLDWDATQSRARGCAEAEHFVQHRYRKGWKI